jgi:hypothetical protein
LIILPHLLRRYPYWSPLFRWKFQNHQHRRHHQTLLKTQHLVNLLHHLTLDYLFHQPRLDKYHHRQNRRLYR